MSGGRPTNLDRQNAIALGFKTYTGSPHAACGTTERYIGGGCAHCARTLATERREAWKFLKAQAAAAAHIASLEAGAEDTETQASITIVLDEYSAENITAALDPGQFVNQTAQEGPDPIEPLDTTEDDGLGVELSEADRFRRSIEDIL
jgi:hypothetical protein